MAPPSSKTVAALAVCTVVGVTIVYLSTKKEKTKKKIEPKTKEDTAAVTHVKDELVEPPIVDRNLVIPEPPITERSIKWNGFGEGTKGKSAPEVSEEPAETSVPPISEKEVNQSQEEEEEEEDNTNGKKASPHKKKRRPKKKKHEAVDASLASKNGAPSPLTETVPEEKKELAPLSVEKPKDVEKSTDNDTKTTDNTDKADSPSKNLDSPSRHRKPRKKKPSTPKQNGNTEASTTTDKPRAPPAVTAAILKQKTQKKKKPAANAAAAAAAKELKSFNESTKKKKHNSTKHWSA